MQHLSTKITCIFLRLSKVRILPNAADHAKKNCPQRNLSPSHTLPRKATPNRASQRAKEKPELEQSFFGGNLPQPIFTTPSYIDRVQHLKNEAKTFTSQSWASLEKLMLHWLEPPKSSKLFATEASFTQAIPNKTRKASLRIVSPQHRSCQNLVLAPLPTSNLEKSKNVPHHFLMFFYNPTPKAPMGSKEHQPHHKLPNFESTAILYQASLSIP